MSIKKLKVIGIDMGFGDTKATDGQKTITFPSVIGLEQLIQYQQTDFLNQAGIHLSIEDNGYFVGEMALQQANVTRQSLDRHRSMVDTKILALSALSELNIKDGEEIFLVTGLPVTWYDADKNNLVSYLTGEHTIHRVGKNKITINIKKVLVIPQPFGTFFYSLLSDSRITNHELKKSLVGIIDVGMYTTDFVLVRNAVYEQPGSSSIETGMAEIYKQLATELERQHGYSPKNKLHGAETAIKRGFIKRPKRTNITPLVEKIAMHVAKSILAEINTYWSGYKYDMDTIFVAGGGASTVGKHFVKRYDYLNIVPDTNTSNVIGYYRYGLLKQRMDKGK